MIGAFCKMPLGFHPGEDWRLSVATDVLAHGIKRATGEHIDISLKKHIIELLGMLETTYCLKYDIISRLMKLYRNEELVRLPVLERGAHELIPLDVSNSYPMQSDAFCRSGQELYSTPFGDCAFVRMLLSRKNDTGERLLYKRTYR